jgi:hypothetical protein
MLVGKIQMLVGLFSTHCFVLLEEKLQKILWSKCRDVHGDDSGLMIPQKMF